MHPLVVEFISPIYKISCLNLQVGVTRKGTYPRRSVNPQGNQIGEEINSMESYRSNSIANSLKPPLKLAHVRRTRHVDSHTNDRDKFLLHLRRCRIFVEHDT